jgi:hypothetical protein
VEKGMLNHKHPHRGKQSIAASDGGKRNDLLYTVLGRQQRNLSTQKKKWGLLIWCLWVDVYIDELKNNTKRKIKVESVCSAIEYVNASSVARTPQERSGFHFLSPRCSFLSPGPQFSQAPLLAPAFKSKIFESFNPLWLELFTPFFWHILNYFHPDCGLKQFVVSNAHFGFIFVRVFISLPENRFTLLQASKSAHFS